MCSCKSSRKLGVSTEARIGESALFLLCQSSHLTQSVFCTIAQISCSGGSQGHRESVFHIIHWVDQKVHSYFSAKTLIGKIGTNFFFFLTKSVYCTSNTSSFSFHQTHTCSEPFSLHDYVCQNKMINLLCKKFFAQYEKE